jgi:hypothetical protein
VEHDPDDRGHDGHPRPGRFLVQDLGAPLEGRRVACIHLTRVRGWVSPRSPAGNELASSATWNPRHGAPRGISVDKVTRAGHAVLRLDGDLDASTFEQLIDTGRKAVGGATSSWTCARCPSWQLRPGRVPHHRAAARGRGGRTEVAAHPRHPAAWRGPPDASPAGAASSVRKAGPDRHARFAPSRR